MKSIQIWSYFWSIFSCIQSKYRKIQTRNNSVFAHFSRSEYFMFAAAKSWFQPLSSTNIFRLRSAAANLCWQFWNHGYNRSGKKTDDKQVVNLSIKGFLSNYFWKSLTLDLNDLFWTICFSRNSSFKQKIDATGTSYFYQ